MRALPLVALALFLTAPAASAGKPKVSLLETTYAAIQKTTQADELLRLIDKAGEARIGHDEVPVEKAREILWPKLNAMAAAAEADGRPATATYLFLLASTIDRSRRETSIEHEDPCVVAMRPADNSFENARRVAAIMAARTWSRIEADSGTVAIAALVLRDVRCGYGFAVREAQLTWPTGAVQFEGQPVFRLTWVPRPDQKPIHRTRDTELVEQTQTSSVVVATEADVERWEKRQAEMVETIDQGAKQHAATIKFIEAQKGTYGAVEQQTQRVTDGTRDGTRLIAVRKETDISAHSGEFLKAENQRWDYESSHLRHLQGQHLQKRPVAGETRNVERVVTRRVETTGWTGELTGAVQVTCAFNRSREIVQTSLVRPSELGDERDEVEVMANLRLQLVWMFAEEVQHVLERDAALGASGLFSPKRSKAGPKERELEFRLVESIFGEGTFQKDPFEITSIAR